MLKCQGVHDIIDSQWESEEEQLQQLTQQRKRVAAGIAEKQEVEDCAMLGKNIQGWELDPADARALYDATRAELDLMSARLAELDRRLARLPRRLGPGPAATAL